jgi:hypothetical protein
MCHVGKMFIREYVSSGNRCRAKGTMSGKRLSGNRGVTILCLLCSFSNLLNELFVFLNYVMFEKKKSSPHIYIFVHSYKEKNRKFDCLFMIKSFKTSPKTV